MIDKTLNSETSPKHPIKVVARRTGLSADVIRAWEHRYGAVSPERSNTNRRLYSDADVERLRLLRRATAVGRRIGDVARLPLVELTNLVGADESAVKQAPVPPVATRPSKGACREHFEACLATLQQMNPSALESALANAAVCLSTPVLLEEVLHPLMVNIGEQWQKGTIRISHEHMATAQVRSFLGTLVNAGNMAGTGPKLLATTPVGQEHELGALMVAVTAALGGWNVTYLGPNTPADEIAFATAQHGVSAVTLSIAYPADDPRLPAELQKLRRRLPAEAHLLVGGMAASGYQEVLDEIGAVQPQSLGELREELDRLRAAS